MYAHTKNIEKVSKRYTVYMHNLSVCVSIGCGVCQYYIKQKNRKGTLHVRGVQHTVYYKK